MQLIVVSVTVDLDCQLDLVWDKLRAVDVHKSIS